MRVRKTITFLFPDGNNYYLYDVGNSISDQPISLVDDLVILGCIDLPSCPKSRKLMVPLQCSLNMLEGDTGCASI